MSAPLVIQDRGRVDVACRSACRKGYTYQSADIQPHAAGGRMCHACADDRNLPRPTVQVISLNIAGQIKDEHLGVTAIFQGERARIIHLQRITCFERNIIRGDRSARDMHV